MQSSSIGAPENSAYSKAVSACLATLVCATAGGYVAAMVNGRSHPWLIGSGLVAILVGVLWMNAWEMRQRGLGHQLAMTLVSVAGVAIGFLLDLR